MTNEKKWAVAPVAVVLIGFLLGLLFKLQGALVVMYFVVWAALAIYFFAGVFTVVLAKEDPAKKSKGRYMVLGAVIAGLLHVGTCVAALSLPGNGGGF